MRTCDLVIVGGGPAGLCAAINAASEGLRVAIVDSKHGLGGQAKESSLLENYPGFPEGITGKDLTGKFVEQAIKFKADILCPVKVVSIGMDGDSRIVTTDDGEQITTSAVVLACGLSYRRLEAKNIPQFLGRGVFYGAPTGTFDEKTSIFVVGGANSAGQAACHLATNKNAQVTMLVRGKNLNDSMSQYLHERIEKIKNIRVLYETEIVEALGHGQLQELTLRSKSDTKTTISADAVYVFIGAAPKTFWLNGIVTKDPKGFILTGKRIQDNWKLERDPFPFETSMPGVFAAGDVRLDSVKRVAAAVGEGSFVVQSVHNYLHYLHSVQKA